MKIAITGATGLVGSALVRERIGRGDEIVVLTRDPDRARDLPDGVTAARFEVGNPGGLAGAFAGADAVVNLAGEPILARRWSAGVKEEIRRSRVEGTRTVVEAMRTAAGGPRVLVNASATGYYGPRERDQKSDEAAPPGDDFLARVCAEWEAAAREAEEFGARVAIVRIGIVLSRDGGALPRMVPPFRWFVGGRIGSGRQGFPWIHEADLTGILSRALDDREVAGPLNAVAPEVPTNAEFSKALARVLRRPSWLPVPGFALRILLGPVARTLTTGQFPVPRRTLATGYRFLHPEATGALARLVGR